MANKVIKQNYQLISLENIFSHKFKSYIYISIKNFYLLARELIQILFSSHETTATPLFVERTKKKKKKFQISPNELEQTFRCTKIARIPLPPGEKVELRTATSGGRNETGREGLRSSFLE